MTLDQLILSLSPSGAWLGNDAADATAAADSAGSHPLAAAAATFGSRQLAQDAERSVAFGGTTLSNSGFTWPAGDFSLYFAVECAAGSTVLLSSLGGSPVLWCGPFSGGELTFAYGGSVLSGGPSLADGVPHDCLVTYQASSGQLTLYTDGVQAAQHSYGASTPSATGLNVGSLLGSSNFFAGNAAKFAVFPAVLSGANATALHAAFSTPAGALVAVADPNIKRSPGNWETASTYLRTINPGAKVSLGFSGTSVGVRVDVSAMDAQYAGNGIPTNQYPRLLWSVDGTPGHYQLQPGDNLVYLATGLASGSHQLDLWLEASSIALRWDGTTSLKIPGFVLDTGATTSAPALLPGKALIFGDSTAEGAWVTAAPVSGDYTGSEEAVDTWGQLLARAFGCEAGVCAFGFQALTGAGTEGIPSLVDAWQLVLSGVSRMTGGGKFSDAPTLIACNIGANGAGGSGDYRALMAAWRAAAGLSCPIVIVTPFDGSGASTVISEFAAYQAVTPDPLTVLANLGALPGFGASINAATLVSTDGIHPNLRGHSRLGAVITRAAGITAASLVPAVLAALASANPNAPAANSAASVLGKFKFTTLGNPLSVPATDAATPLVIAPLPIGTLLTIIGGNGAYNLTQDGGVGDGGAAITLNGVALTTDSLRVLDANNVAVPNAAVQLFLATDTTYTAYVGTTFTGVDGRWIGPIKANSGSYTLLVSAQGEQVDVVTGLVVP